MGRPIFTETFLTNTNPIRKVPLRGAERRNNPNKNEIAAPFGLAMTCNDIYCVCIRLIVYEHSSKKSTINFIDDKTPLRGHCIFRESYRFFEQMADPKLQVFRES
jgi:hypothetical protein